MTFYNNLNQIFKEYYNQLENDFIKIKIQVKTTATDLKLQELEINDRNYLQNWFLSGNFGSGKTKIAVQIVKLWQQNQNKAQRFDQDQIYTIPKFVSLQDYIELNNRSIQFKELYKQIDVIKEAYLLILDDISLSFWTENNINLITSLVKYRHENRLQTIFTSNKGLSALSKEIPAITSRIIEMCGLENCILFEARDYRITQKSSKTFLELELIKNTVEKVEFMQNKALDLTLEEQLQGFWQLIQPLAKLGSWQGLYDILENCENHINFGYFKIAVSQYKKFPKTIQNKILDLVKQKLSNN